MTLHEIIHEYLKLGHLAGGYFLLGLVNDAGLSREMMEHIQGCELKTLCQKG